MSSSSSIIDDDVSVASVAAEEIVGGECSVSTADDDRYGYGYADELNDADRTDEAVDAPTLFGKRYPRTYEFLKVKRAAKQTGKAVVKPQATVAKCEYCGIIMKHPSKIAAHLRTHTGEKPFRCPICDKRFSQSTPLTYHMRRHMGDTPFTCNFGCGKKFASSALRNAHETVKHLKLKRRGPPQPHLKPPKRYVPMSYDIFEEMVTSHLVMQPPLGELPQPLSAKSRKKVQEVIDQVATGSRGSLTDREAGGSGGDSVGGTGGRRAKSPTVAECRECGLVLKHPSKIRAHIRCHTGEKPFTCQYCDEKFTRAHAVGVHVKRMHTSDRPFPCTWECGKSFVTVAAKNEHEKIVHAGIRRYRCTFPHCHRLFSRRVYLVEHEKRHNPTQIIPIRPECPITKATVEEVHREAIEKRLAVKGKRGGTVSSSFHTGPIPTALGPEATIGAISPSKQVYIHLPDEVLDREFVMETGGETAGGDRALDERQMLLVENVYVYVDEDGGVQYSAEG